MNYRVDTNKYTIITVKYLSKSLKYNGLGTSQSLSVEKGITVGVEDSKSMARSFDLSYLPDGHGVSTSRTYERTRSFTTTKSHAETYTVELTKEDKIGFYTWEARIDADEYEVYLYWRPTKTNGWAFKGKGTAFSFRSEYPYIELGYTTFSVN